MPNIISSEPKKEKLTSKIRIFTDGTVVVTNFKNGLEESSETFAPNPKITQEERKANILEEAKIKFRQWQQFDTNRSESKEEQDRRIYYLESYFRPIVEETSVLGDLSSLSDTIKKYRDLVSVGS